MTNESSRPGTHWINCGRNKRDQKWCLVKDNISFISPDTYGNDLYGSLEHFTTVASWSQYGLLSIPKRTWNIISADFARNIVKYETPVPENPTTPLKRFWEHYAAEKRDLRSRRYFYSEAQSSYELLVAWGCVPSCIKITECVWAEILLENILPSAVQNLISEYLYPSFSFTPTTLPILTPTPSQQTCRAQAYYKRKREQTKVPRMKKLRQNPVPDKSIHAS